ncbi:sensor domain-containing diguanylate cyclase [Vulgatibacter incomptus]|uniref:diguanylate cyclase n=1 Tax=Vulgatibacter incomptus TaxID=1391653 RepID=A0A0K1PCG0_9BACT|nr:sensor domain-containing diguanylate cyclase [Vulgatibacter incomptus]AKU91208.1 diguanylate cyclase/phosphodiesterase (GGDEF & EAL domains) with PAS/PAC sensor(s) [Vulgatibacter incomptus]
MEAEELLRELKRNVDELHAYNEIGKALTSTLDIREVLRLIMEKVGELLQPTNWSLLLVDEITGELFFEVAVGPGSESLQGLRIGAEEGIAGWVASRKESLLVADVSQDERFASRFDEATRFSTSSIAAVPMRSKGRTLGVIELVNGRGQPPFDEADVRVLGSIADFAAIALENARNYRRVEELTIIDEHTGLYNARHLLRSLDAEILRARRFGHDLSLVFFDLDRFKQVNDRHGHQAGSAILRECGEELLQVIRPADIAIRYGGDEFVCLLPETTSAEALAFAERVRERFKARAFLESEAGGLRLTASFGVASFPEHAADADELLRRADLAMYRVKGSTRDGIQVG